MNIQNFQYQQIPIQGRPIPNKPYGRIQKVPCIPPMYPVYNLQFISQKMYQPQMQPQPPPTHKIPLPLIFNSSDAQGKYIQLKQQMTFKTDPKQFIEYPSMSNAKVILLFFPKDNRMINGKIFVRINNYDIDSQKNFGESNSIKCVCIGNLSEYKTKQMSVFISLDQLDANCYYMVLTVVTEKQPYEIFNEVYGKNGLNSQTFVKCTKCGKILNLENLYQKTLKNYHCVCEHCNGELFLKNLKIVDDVSKQWEEESDDICKAKMKVFNLYAMNLLYHTNEIKLYDNIFPHKDKEEIINNNIITDDINPEKDDLPIDNSFDLFDDFT